jgi:hypothetical protein
MIVLSLGPTACRIADKFSSYPGYKLYKISHDLVRIKNNLKVPQYEQFYEYEQTFPQDKLDRFLKTLRGEVLFVTCGSEPISLLSLRVLEILSKSCTISICYIKLDQMLVGQEKKEIEKLVYEMLQNYTLSGYVQQMYLFDNTLVEKMCQDIDVFNYYDKVYEMISWILHTNNSLKYQDAIFDNLNKTREMGIKSFSLGSLEGEQKNSTFLLDKVTEEKVYYVINKNLIQQNKELFNTIRNDIQKESIGINKKMCYAVYSTELEQSLVLTEQQSLIYQK